MTELKHAAPETISGACSLLEEYGEQAAILSGGQSLLPTIRQRVASYDVVVDINELEERAYIDVDEDEDWLRFGCLVRHAEIAESAVVRTATPIVAETAGQIGDVQVRQRGTFCGAVAHADPSGDPPVLASLLDADIVATSTDGKTVYDGQSFYHGSHETELGENELVSEVRFPVLGETEGAGYERWKPSEVAYPVAIVGAYVDVDDGTVTEARLCTGALEAGPTEMTEAAAALEGEVPDDAAIRETAETLGENTMPREDFEGSTEFKRQISKTLAKDALETAIERAGV
jgi:carbon-monoxide dehydrogenase medium subunit